MRSFSCLERIGNTLCSQGREGAESDRSSRMSEVKPHSSWMRQTSEFQKENRDEIANYGSSRCVGGIAFLCTRWVVCAGSERRSKSEIPNSRELSGQDPGKTRKPGSVLKVSASECKWILAGVRHPQDKKVESRPDHPGCLPGRRCKPPQ